MRVEHNLTQARNIAKLDALVPHLYVSPVDEALLVTIYENFQPKWNFELEHKAVLLDKDHAEHEKTKKEWEALDKKYTEAKGGQVPFAGWTQKGRHRVKALEELNKKARKTDVDGVETMETAARMEIRYVGVVFLFALLNDPTHLLTFFPCFQKTPQDGQGGSQHQEEEEEEDCRGGGVGL